jgi:hypothetical protein
MLRDPAKVLSGPGSFSLRLLGFDDRLEVLDSLFAAEDELFHKHRV